MPIRCRLLLTVFVFGSLSLAAQEKPPRKPAGRLAAKSAPAKSAPAKAAPARSVGPAAPTTADQKFDAVLRDVERTLKSARNYRATISSRWKMNRPDGATSGTQVVSLTVENPHQLRLEVSSDAAPQAKYLVVSDGQNVYREFTGQRLYSLSPAAQPRESIENDGVTLPTLHSLGIEFLLRTDLHGSIASQTIRVEDHGTAVVNNQPQQTFTMLLANRQQAKVTISTRDRFVPTELQVNVLVPVSDGKSYDYEVTSRLEWEFDQALPASTFQFQPPTGGQRIADFGAYTRAGQSTAAIGAAAPPLSWPTLSDTPFQLGSLRGKSVAVLIFWATWAAPSTDELPGIRQFVEAYSRRGVTFVLVNVGEPRELVKAFADQAGYKSTIALDPRAESMAALGIDTVPAVVIVAKDGSLQSIQKYRPEGQPLKDRVQTDLDALLSGLAVPAPTPP